MKYLIALLLLSSCTVPVIVQTDDPPIPPSPVVRWIHEYEEHAGQTVNLIMRSGPDVTWRTRCIGYGGHADRIYALDIDPTWGPQLIDVCLDVPG